MNDAQPHHVELDSSTRIVHQDHVQLWLPLVKHGREVRREIRIEEVVKPDDRAGYQRDERVHPEELLERSFLAVVAKEAAAEVVVLHALFY